MRPVLLAILLQLAISASTVAQVPDEYQFRVGCCLFVSKPTIFRTPDGDQRLPRGHSAIVKDMRGSRLFIDVDGVRGWVRQHEVSFMISPTDIPEVSNENMESHQKRVTELRDLNDEREEERVAAEQTLDSAERALFPQLDLYRRQFQDVAQKVQSARHPDEAKLESWRSQAKQLTTAQLTKPLVVKVKPALAALRRELLPARVSVLQRSRTLQRARRQLKEAAASWQQAARDWAQLQQAPHEQLTLLPSSEALVQWHEEFALLMLLADPDAEAALLNIPRKVFRLGPEEAAGLNELNRLRLLVRLRPVELNLTLSDVCRDHCYDMHHLEFFSHFSPVPEKLTPWHRADRFSRSAWDENIAKGPDTAAHAVDAWYHSPGHLGNMLNPQHRSVGVARHHQLWAQLFKP